MRPGAVPAPVGSPAASASVCGKSRPDLRARGKEGQWRLTAVRSPDPPGRPSWSAPAPAALDPAHRGQSGDHLKRASVVGGDSPCAAALPLGPHLATPDTS